jgi:catechol 2,3-dioxygenase-like lactoylglutathione lyase family enzyme
LPARNFDFAKRNGIWYGGFRMADLPIPTIGLRHLALRVASVATSKRFYCEIFGMAPVWEPDDKTAYLSSGSDNLALHQLDDGAQPSRDPTQALDHLGFLLTAPSAVYAAAEAVRARGERILQEPREHRDGSHSFYMADPDGNVVQVLFEPNVAARHSTAAKP